MKNASQIKNLVHPFHGHQMSSGQLRQLLGLPKRLAPETQLACTLVGDTEVFVYTHEDAKLLFGNKGARIHRIYAKCNECRKLIPAGRLHQHRKTHKK